MDRMNNYYNCNIHESDRSTLWLESVPSELRHIARDRLADGDFHGFLSCAPSSHGMGFVLRNHDELLQRGIYEEALVEAFMGCTVNNSELPLGVIQRMFQLANPLKLRKLGPLPGEGPFTLYRGVSGHGVARRVRGFSWTDDFDRAKWFASRFPDLGSPAVHQAVVPDKFVLLFTDERDESEYIVSLPPGIGTKIVWTG